MNKINNIDSISKSYSNQTNNSANKQKAEKNTTSNTEATITYTKPSLKAEDVENTAEEVLKHAKNNASKALDASTSNLDEARIRALLED